MRIDGKPSSCSSSASSKLVTLKPVPPKAWLGQVLLSSPVYGSIKCSFWTTIGIIDLSLTSRRSSMRPAGASPPELRAGFKYIFRQDGSLEVRIEATGETLNRGVTKVEEGEEFGTMVTTYVAAPNHQHLLNFRLDLDIDETENNVVEANISSVPSEFGNAFAVTETMLKTESE